MSTRSEIGILNNNGTIESIYCHWDGYPEHNGFLLFVYYPTEEKARELIKNGDLSSLRENINPDKNFKHSFDDSQKDVCVYYHRDRGEDWQRVKPQITLNIEEWEKQVQKGWQEYMYLFKNNEWYFSPTEYIKWKKLTSDFLKTELKNSGWNEQIKVLEQIENKKATTMLEHDSSNNN